MIICFIQKRVSVVVVPLDRENKLRMTQVETIEQTQRSKDEAPVVPIVIDKRASTTTKRAGSKEQ